MLEYESFAKQLIDGYVSNYDIERFENRDDNLIATAHMHVTESQCVIFKELRMWDANADEYVYFFYIPHLTVEAVDAAINMAHADGMPRIDLENVTLKHQHMCTHLVTLILADDADKEAIKKLKKCKIYKSFQFSLKGWMDMQTELITLSDGKVYSNGYGQETAKFLKKHVKHYQKNHV